METQYRRIDELHGKLVNLRQWNEFYQPEILPAILTQTARKE